MFHKVYVNKMNDNRMLYNDNTCFLGNLIIYIYGFENDPWHINIYLTKNKGNVDLKIFMAILPYS